MKDYSVIIRVTVGFQAPSAAKARQLAGDIADRLSIGPAGLGKVTRPSWYNAAKWDVSIEGVYE